MSEALVILSGLLAGLVQWFPCGIGLAAHRYKLGGAVVSSSNKWVLLSIRSPQSFSLVGRIIFMLAILIWLCVFFGSMAVPMFVAKLVAVPASSPAIQYAIYANFSMAVVAFLAGPFIWRRIAL